MKIGKMKLNHYINYVVFGLLTLVLGMAGLVLQNLLFAFATDRKGLLASHPLGFLLGALTGAALVLILAGVLRWQQEPLVPLRPNTWDVVTLITTLGFLPVLFRDGFAPSRLILVRNVLAILVVLSFLALFLLRRRDMQPALVHCRKQSNGF